MSLNESKLISFNDIKEEIKLIDENSTDYISVNGNVYKKHKNLFYKKKLYVNKRNGYVYCGITYKNEDGTNKNISKRIHILVAKAFIENSNNYPVVGHKNNIKNDNNVENLYWTTIQENTQKAVDDGLLVNDKGFQDSQSIPVDVYTDKGIFIETIGSASLAAKKYMVSKSTVFRHCNNEIKGKKRSKVTFKYPTSSLQTIENTDKVEVE